MSTDAFVTRGEVVHRAGAAAASLAGDDDFRLEDYTEVPLPPIDKSVKLDTPVLMRKKGCLERMRDIYNERLNYPYYAWEAAGTFVSDIRGFFREIGDIWRLWKSGAVDDETATPQWRERAFRLWDDYCMLISLMIGAAIPALVIVFFMVRPRADVYGNTDNRFIAVPTDLYDWKWDTVAARDISHQRCVSVKEKEMREGKLEEGPGLKELATSMCDIMERKGVSALALVHLHPKLNRCIAAVRGAVTCSVMMNPERVESPFGVRTVKSIEGSVFCPDKRASVERETAITVDFVEPALGKMRHIFQNAEAFVCRHVLDQLAGISVCDA